MSKKLILKILNSKDNIQKKDLILLNNKLKIKNNGTKEEMLNAILKKYKIDKNDIYALSNFNKMKAILNINNLT